MPTKKKRVKKSKAKKIEVSKGEWFGRPENMPMPIVFVNFKTKQVGLYYEFDERKA